MFLFLPLSSSSLISHALEKPEKKTKQATRHAELEAFDALRASDTGREEGDPAVIVGNGGGGGGGEEGGEGNGGGRREENGGNGAATAAASSSLSLPQPRHLRALCDVRGGAVDPQAEARRLRLPQPEVRGVFFFLSFFLPTPAQIFLLIFLTFIHTQ